MGRLDVVEAWETGLLGACSGQTRRLVSPASLAYGDSGISVAGAFEVAPGQDLVYTVEVLRVAAGELPAAGIEEDPAVEEALRKMDRRAQHGFKVVGPRTSKHRERNQKRSNHPLAKEALRKKRRVRAEREVRKQLRARRMGVQGGTEGDRWSGSEM
jgi:hypothetical protein